MQAFRLLRSHQIVISLLLRFYTKAGIVRKEHVGPLIMSYLRWSCALFCEHRWSQFLKKRKPNILVCEYTKQHDGIGFEQFDFEHKVETMLSLSLQMYYCKILPFIQRFILAVDFKYQSLFCIAARVRYRWYSANISSFNPIFRKWHFAKLGTLSLQRIARDWPLTADGPSGYQFCLGRLLRRRILFYSRFLPNSQHSLFFFYQCMYRFAIK